MRQFRNPEKQQILPSNLTKEIIDETSILYKETPVYQVIDGNGKIIEKDQKLWEEIMEKGRYSMIMDKVDRWTRLLGTVLVKASFIDPNTGLLVQKNEGGQIQFDCMHGGVYDVRYGASPYYITELLIGFGNKFNGFSSYTGNPSTFSGSGIATPNNNFYGLSTFKVNDASQLKAVNRIYWSPTSHKQHDADNQEYEVENPYGLVPAVPFFNQDPAHYYFLPINEPLIYANHAINMRLTDLNHIAKFQSFGVPVISGSERPTSTRQGRPVDDFNILKGGSAQSRFGGVAGSASFGAGGQYRNFDAGMGMFRDGNADANALGFSLGPDTAVAVGEKGDFKFAHPGADITGLIKVIESLSDIVRINHGLRPKYNHNLPPSGFAMWMEKAGVIDENRRRGRLFKEREQQLFHVIKKLWNTHYSKMGDRRFSEDSRLEVTYIDPKFPLDPKTKMEETMMEIKLQDTGNRQAYKKLYPHLTDAEVNKMIKKFRKDKLEQAEADAELEVAKAKIFREADIVANQATDSTKFTKDGAWVSSTNNITVQPDEEQKDLEVAEPKIDNRAKHSADSSKQYKIENQIKKGK